MGTRGTTGTDVREGGGPVVVRGDGVAVQRRRSPTELTVVRRHFGGRDLPAIVAGALAAFGLLAVLLLPAVTVTGSVDVVVGRGRDMVIAAAGTLAALTACGFLGGWVSGRVARYDGGRNARWSTALFLVLGAGLLLPAWTRDVVVPRVRVTGSMDTITLLVLTGGVVAAIGLLLVAAWLGGRRGSGYHDAADGMLLCIRDGDLRHLRKDRP